MKSNGARDDEIKNLEQQEISKICKKLHNYAYSNYNLTNWSQDSNPMIWSWNINPMIVKPLVEDSFKQEDLELESFPFKMEKSPTSFNSTCNLTNDKHILVNTHIIIILFVFTKESSFINEYLIYDNTCYNVLIRSKWIFRIWMKM